jgi:hypothetical protein
LLTTLTSYVPLQLYHPHMINFKLIFFAISIFIQPHKCIAWSLFCLLPNFITPSKFSTPLQGIIILGIQLGISSFTSSFIKNALLKDVQHIDLFLRMGDVQVTWRGKKRHHYEEQMLSCNIIRFYANLFNGKWNATCTSCCKVAWMWSYSRGWWKLKWKDPRTSNVETQT